MDFNNIEDLSKEELIKLINHQTSLEISKKASLKENMTPTMLKNEDTLFIIPNGFLIGKPYVEELKSGISYITISDVIVITSVSPVKSVTFNGNCFQLAVDQIIAFSPIDRDSFLNQLQSQQVS